MKLILLALGTAVPLLMQSSPAVAQAPAFPKTVTLIVPFAPGASNDVFARMIAQELGPKLGSTIVIENKPGAGASIGAHALAKSPPNGGTFMLTSSTFTTHAGSSANVPYDPIKDFTPVAMIARAPLLVAVNNDTPFKSVADLVKAAQTDKGAVNYGSSGTGSIPHLATELFNEQIKGEMTHIPYKGISNVVTDLIGGRLQLLIVSPPSIAGPVEAKRLRVLAVTSKEPSKFAPDLPTVSQTVPGYNVSTWWGIFAPADTPPALVQRMNQEVLAIINTPDMQQRFAKEGADAASAHSPADFAAHVKQEIELWTRLSKERGIKAE